MICRSRTSNEPEKQGLLTKRRSSRQSDIHEPIVREWICEVCHARNAATSSDCSVCHQPRIVENSILKQGEVAIDLSSHFVEGARHREKSKSHRPSHSKRRQHRSMNLPAKAATEEVQSPVKIEKEEVQSPVKESVVPSQKEKPVYEMETEVTHRVQPPKPVTIEMPVEEPKPSVSEKRIDELEVFAFRMYDL